MRKLIVLTAVAMLTASAVGCQCGRWFRRGALFPTWVPEPVCSEPSIPYDPCEPATLPPYETVTPPVTPGPETYTPGPSS